MALNTGLESMRLTKQRSVFKFIDFHNTPTSNMDFVWSQPNARPKFLYRVCHPKAWTRYFPLAGFISSLLHTSNRHPFLMTCAIDEPNSFRAFLKSIRNHCNQTLAPTPWISTFSSEKEAEMWCLAAEDIFGKECYIMVIDTQTKEMEPIFWLKVKDLLTKIGDNMGLGDLGSECLIFGQVPKEAILPKEFWIFGSEIRAKYELRSRQQGLAQKLTDPKMDMARVPKYDNTLFEYPLWEPNYKPAGMDNCECVHIDVCMHFDWNFG